MKEVMSAHCFFYRKSYYHTSELQNREGKKELLSAATTLLPKTCLNLAHLSFWNKPLLALPASMRFGSKNDT